jgi:hypothetical protein
MEPVAKKVAKFVSSSALRYLLHLTASETFTILVGQPKFAAARGIVRIGPIKRWKRPKTISKRWRHGRACGADDRYVYFRAW